MQKSNKESFDLFIRTPRERDSKIVSIEKCNLTLRKRVIHKIINPLEYEQTRK